MKKRYFFFFLILFLYLSSELYPQNCGGIERWDVKVLSDAEADEINTEPIETTVSELRSFDTKKIPGDDSRQGYEFYTYTVECKIAFYIREADSDYHVVLKDLNYPRRTLIAEVPLPGCRLVNESGYASQYSAVRNFLESIYTRRQRGHSSHRLVQNGVYRVTGVAFIDFNHRQTGRAPNDLELHPILSIEKIR